MKVYCVMACDFGTGETVLKEVFRKREKAMDEAKFFANERVKGYSQTRKVEECDDRYIVRWEEEEDAERELGDVDAVAVYYVVEKLVIN